jgi:hypothetical protein
MDVGAVDSTVLADAGVIEVIPSTSYEHLEAIRMLPAQTACRR